MMATTGRGGDGGTMGSCFKPISALNLTIEAGEIVAISKCCQPIPPHPPATGVPITSRGRVNCSIRPFRAGVPRARAAAASRDAAVPPDRTANPIIDTS
jgi:hypothetical protein